MIEAIFQIQLDKEKKIPLYQQLVEHMIELITQGHLLPDSKLPPIRKLAQGLQVNTVTIVAAYKFLEQKQMVYSRQGSGTFVSPLPIEAVPEPVVQGSLYRFHIGNGFENAINFATTSLPHSLFPVEEFKKAFNQVLEKEQGGAFRYTDSMGYSPLRQQLCRYLSSCYGIKTTADAVQIISGAQQGIDILSKAMVQYGDIVFVETPTFYGAIGAFLSRGAKLIEIPLESDGMKIEVLEDYLKIYHPKFIYMMAYFQTPTGISYSIEKKSHLLELAERYDTYIIEEDDFYDFYYTKEIPIPLKALDYKNRVIYIKSFSKILMPGLRMGLMVLPKKIQQGVLEAKYTTDISTSGFIQRAMEVYLEENHWEKHGKVMRSFGSNKYRRTLSFAKKYLGNQVSYLLPKGGISLWISLPKGILAENFSTRLLEKNVIVTPGSQFELTPKDLQYIRINFAGLDDDKIQVGLKRMGETLATMIEEHIE